MLWSFGHLPKSGAIWICRFATLYEIIEAKAYKLNEWTGGTDFLTWLRFERRSLSKKCKCPFFRPTNPLEKLPYFLALSSHSDIQSKNKRISRVDDSDKMTMQRNGLWHFYLLVISDHHQDECARARVLYHSYLIWLFGRVHIVLQK